MSTGPVAIILGIRPDVIRASLILESLRAELGSELVFIWSGQHYSSNLRDVFFEQLAVAPPTITWQLAGFSDGEIVSDIVYNAEKTFADLSPRAVILLGDTNTVMASVAAASRNIPIFHIEGCMRSYDWRMPEEKYRTVADHLSDQIYAYLPEYKEQGLAEGLSRESIEVTGNPIVDVLEAYFLSGRIRMSKQESFEMLGGLETSPGNFLLMTCHRRENVEDTESLSSIMKLAGSSDRTIVFPAGYRTQRELSERRISVPENLRIIDPIGYRELLELLVSSAGVLTDSGTVVEEAAILGVPSIQMRRSTERPQVYECGASLKFNPLEHISDESENRNLMLTLDSLKGREWSHPFGDGNASSRIVADILTKLESKSFSRKDKPPESEYASRAYSG